MRHAVLLALACSSSSTNPPSHDAATPAADGAVVDAATAPPDAAPDAAGLANPFRDGPYGTHPFDVAGPFTLPTTGGDWDFSSSWTGQDSHVFVIHAPGNAYSDAIWASPIAEFLDASPPNVHWFFLSYGADAESDVTALKARIDAAVRYRPAWRGRVHFVTTRAQRLDNWIGRMLRAAPQAAFGIDRFQRVREAGLLQDLGTGEQSLRLLTHEPAYWEFEWAREQALAAEGAMVLPVFTAMPLGDATADVALPDAATMATFDTMEIDATLDCVDAGGVHGDMNCGDWDFIANVFLCDRDDPTQCSTEIDRLITTYKREGRWVTDVSPLLALISDGGTRRFRFSSGQTYLTTLSLRLSHQGKGGHPSGASYLYSGGGFNQDYNTGRMPTTFTVPADVTRVQVYALITGHGWGQDADNCAEFCDSEHHFTVNGHDYALTHPEAGTPHGCADKVGRGVVPNQFGTWPFGRDGWCPGWDVKPWVIDVTDAVTHDGDNTLTYRGLFMGADYVPRPASMPNPTGFSANITMSSWLVFWR